MSNQQDPPIVVTGGSVHIEFDQDSFTLDGKGKHKHSDGNKKIKSVVVEVGDQPAQTFNVPNGKVTVTIKYSK
jgi:hypothetical protein